MGTSLIRPFVEAGKAGGFGFGFGVEVLYSYSMDKAVW